MKNLFDRQLSYTGVFLNRTTDIHDSGDASSLTKSSSNIKFINFSLYLRTILTGLYPDPDPLTQLNPDPIQIRIEVAIGNRLGIAIKCGIRIRTVLLQVKIRNTYSVGTVAVSLMYGPVTRLAPKGNKKTCFHLPGRRSNG